MPPEEKSQQIRPEQLDKNMHIDGPATQPLEWHSPKEPPFRIAGFGWFAKDKIYRRLPVEPAYPFRSEVNGLANCTAGGQIHFKTNSTRLYVRPKLTGSASMVLMAPYAQCGFDCYIGPPTKQSYINTGDFSLPDSQYEAMLFKDMPPEMREITINMPLYQGIEELSLGLDPGAQILPPQPYARKGCCVVYGTSIVHGAAASRPGMIPTNILSRRFNIEFINLGFSGNARGEPELAHLITEIENPLVYVLDYEANCHGIENLRKTLPEFIRILRAAQPTTPIVVFSCTPFTKHKFSEKPRSESDARRALQRETVEALRKAGDTNIEFVDGSKSFGTDGSEECTVDGIHPTDLGFYRIAEYWTPILKRVLLP